MHYLETGVIVVDAVMLNLLHLRHIPFILIIGLILIDHC